MSHNPNSRSFLPLWIGLAVAFTLVTIVAAAFQLDIVGPPGSGEFGTIVTVLPNGNLVVTDPYYDSGSLADVGAVYLYDGATGALISTLTGSTSGDRVGLFGVIVLSNGNYVVRSPYWDNGATLNAGAATWGSVTAGVSGTVSAANSLVGSTAEDMVGYTVTALPNGNYLVKSPWWDNGAATDAGAVTWGSGSAGISGEVSAANSLVGSAANDMLGYDGAYDAVTVLANSNYLVSSPFWDNGAAADAGAVTWGSATIGISGAVCEANSLVGSSANDQVGSYGVTALANGNYLVSSYSWDNGAATDAGAATWGSGASGVSGVVSAANSLVGSSAGDHVGSVWELANGNYVVRSPWWDNGAATDAGAVTWGSGTSGITGLVSPANSLVGTTDDDSVGYPGVTALSNGNYVVSSPYWHNGGVIDAGAATWGNGTSGISGPVSAANSLVGSSEGDLIGINGVTELANGNYVVSSPSWDNGGVIDTGAATWSSGTSGINGAVSPTNSLVGSTSNDWVSRDGVTALANGNYVVSSRYWDNGGVMDAGAVTWANGTSGVSGVVSAANSLVGRTSSDLTGSLGVTALANGNYVVSSPDWNNGDALIAGAVTWSSGTSGITGPISAVNSLVGSTISDQVGILVTALANGNYVVRSPYWDNDGVTDAGAVTWGSGTSGVSGTVSAANSLVGSTNIDRVGYHGLTALSTGNYVVSSLYWDNGGVFNAGAITWGSGTSGVSGSVSAANSLVGSRSDDYIGYLGVTELANGNYVVRSPYWDNDGVTNAGAVTWASGISGISGTVSAANSLVGSTSGDQVGEVITLTNGNYVVHSLYWDNGATVDAGATTWGSGTTGFTGPISAANSLVGSTVSDRLGYFGVTALANGDYVVHSPYWDDGATANAGAITIGDGSGGTSGSVSAGNSVRGVAANGGLNMDWAFDDTYDQLVVSRPADNIVTLFRPNAPNQAPAANAGPDQSVPCQSLVTLDGSASSDPESNLPLSYLWTQTGGPLVSLSDAHAVAPTFSAPGDPAVITFALVVTDSLGLPDTTPDEIVITVTNRAPQANAGIDQAVHAGDFVSLDGSASFDTDGDLPLVYLWTQTGGPKVSLSDPQVVNPAFSTPGNASVITFTLLVTDSLGLPDPTPDEIVIIVTNQAPVADAGADQEVHAGDLVTLDGSASSDPEGDLPLSYLWEQNSGTPVTIIGTTTPNPTFTAPAVNTDAVKLTITLIVADKLGLASPPAQVLITVKPHWIYLPMTSR